jgi:hypothetical protein
MLLTPLYKRRGPRRSATSLLPQLITKDGAGEHERAARLLGAGEAMIEAAEMTLSPGTTVEYERHVERTREAVGEREYERAVRTGRALDRDAAIQYALGA